MNDIPVQVQVQVGVGAVAQPFFFFGKLANPRVISVPVLHIKDDLKMQMGRPISIFKTHSEFCKNLAPQDPFSRLQIFYGVEA